MTLTLQTAIREILTTDKPLQHYEALHLTSERFRLEKGVWVRRTGFESKVFEIIWEVPGRETPKTYSGMQNSC